MKRNFYIVVLAGLFLGAAYLLDQPYYGGKDFWTYTGLGHPHGYRTQGLLFLSLLFVLQNFLFDPYVKVLEERESLTIHKKSAAEKTRASADQMITEYNAAIEKARVKATIERERLALDAENEEREHLRIAKEKASKEVQVNLTNLEAEAKAAKPELDSQIQMLAKEISSQVTSGSSGGRKTVGESRMRSSL